MKKNRMCINMTVYLLALSIFFGLGSPFAMVIPDVSEVKDTAQASKETAKQAAKDAIKIDPASNKVQLPAGVSTNWWSSVQEEIKKSEYQVRWQEKTPLKDLASAYQSPNRANNFRTYYTPEGVRVVPRTETTPSWEWGLNLKAIGSADDMQAVEAAKMKHTGNRMEYRRGPITEWYVNDKKGLEQGFTLANSPSEKNTNLVLEMEITGNVTAALSGGHVSFTAPNGTRVIDYSKLHVFDAAGRTLPAQFALLEKKLSILVDAENAVYPVTIDPLATASEDWSANGTAGSGFGFSVATAGDVNGDGYSDVIVGVPDYDVDGTNFGRVSIYYGSSTGLVSGPDAALAPMHIPSAGGAESFGFSVATAGNVDGDIDGFADVIVGAPEYGDNGNLATGRVYVYYGSSSGLTIINGNPNGSDWNVMGEAAGDKFGFSVATAGDVAQDSYSDVLIGAPFNGTNSEGRAYVFYGTNANSGLNLNAVSTSPDWSANGTVDGTTGSQFGTSVATAGDVNGDGASDIIIGAPRATGSQSNEGRAYVYHGSKDATPGLAMPASPSWVADPANDLGARFGFSVATAGDVNGDGYADVIIGAKSRKVTINSVTNNAAGSAYVYYGGSGGLPTMTTSTDAELPNWIAEGTGGNIEFGTSVAPAGDVNGDGFGDVIIGASAYAEPGVPGQAFVFLGSGNGLSNGATNPVLSTTADTTLTTGQPDDEFGISVAPAGDVNGDGFADVIVGASEYDDLVSDPNVTNAGGAFVYHGAPAGLNPAPNWSAEGGETSAEMGFSVASAGDVNEDGFGDVIVGVPGFDPSGAAFVFHGGSGFGPLAGTPYSTLLGNPASFGSKFGASVASAGDVNGDGYADVIVGAPLDDDGTETNQDEGRAYVYTGTGVGGLGVTPSPVWTGKGNQSLSNFGVSVSTAGDVNGDGYSDIIVGANKYTTGSTAGAKEGAAFVYHGSTAGLNTTVDWTAESSDPGSQFGFSVSTAGDVNADGYTDVIIGAFNYLDGAGREGRAFVYHGGTGGLSTLAPSPTTPSGAAWAVGSGQIGSEFGFSVSTAGDVNNDGYADVIVGSPAFNNSPSSPEGRVFVYHGGDLSNSLGLSLSVNWFAKGEQAFGQFGNAVSTAGDVNGDGIADVVIGARFDDDLTNSLIDAGAAHAFHGSKNGLSNGTSTGVSSATADWVVKGGQANAQFGFAVSSAGDVNGDGYADVIVGERLYDDSLVDEGRASVYFGNSSDGLAILPEQKVVGVGMGGDELISPLGHSDERDRFKISAVPRSPFGQTSARLEWEVKELGMPFDGLNTFKGQTSVPTFEPNLSNPFPSITPQLVDKLSGEGTPNLLPGTHYHWRARFLYDPASSPFQQASRWFTVPWNGWNEEDLKTKGNVAPVAVDDTASTNEDTLVIISVLTNDPADAEGDTRTVSIVLSTSGATVTTNGTTVDYTPPTDFPGPTDTFTYKLNDGFTDSNTATVTVTITPVNDAPEAVNDPSIASLTTPEDTPLGFNGSVIVANDTDVDNTVPTDLSVASVTSSTGQGGTVVLDLSTGGITYTPPSNFNGPDTFTYKVTDGSRQSPSSATVTINVTPENDPPVAGADSATVNEDASVTTVDVRLNDSDPDLGDTLTVTGNTNPSNGSVTADLPNGTFTYTPKANFEGPTDSFSYTVTDGNLATAIGTVTITINAVPDPPDAVDDTLNILEDSGPFVPNLLGNDHDPDTGTTLLIINFVQPATNHSTIGLTAGILTYTPDSNFSGEDTFTYTISDGDSGTADDTATVTINVGAVNDAPVAVDDSTTIDEDSSLVLNGAGSAFNVLSNDTDVDLPPQTLTLASVSGATSGTVTNNTGIFTYMPDPDFNGSETLTYTVSDNQDTDTGTVTITVTAVSDDPIANLDTFTVSEDAQQAQIPLPGSVLDNDVDPDGTAVTFSGVFTQASHGDVVSLGGGIFTYTPLNNYHGLDSFTYTIIDGNGGTAIGPVNITVTPVNDKPTPVNDSATTPEDTPVTTVNVLTNTAGTSDSDIDGDTLSIIGHTQGSNGSVAFNSADNTFTYTPNLNFNGSDVFDYIISDGNGGTATGMVNMTVTPVQDSPVAGDDAMTTDEGVGAQKGNFLDNDSDVDVGDILSVSTLTQASNGIVINHNNGFFTYTPNGDFNGTDSFTYTVSDGNGGTDVATVNVTVNPVNDAPIAVNDSASTDEDSPVGILHATLLANDSDIDGGTLSVFSVTQPANGTVTNISDTVTYTPNPDFNGSDSFTYDVSDSNGGTATGTVNVTVNPVNDPPVTAMDQVVTNEDFPVDTPNVLLNDNDIDGGPLTITSFTQGASGSVVAKPGGVFTYTPNGNFNGSDSFTYTISDGNGGTDTGTVEVTATAVNDNPVAVNDAAIVNEDASVILSTLRDNDSDVDGDPLTITGVGPAGVGAATVNADGTVTYTPDADVNGSDSFTYTISDGVMPVPGTATATVTVTINPVNDLPVANADIQTTTEDVAGKINVVGNDSDPDGHTLTVIGVTQGSSGSVVNNSDGTVTYTPSLNFNGTDTFTYEISDGNSGLATGTVTVTVSAGNDAPVASPDNATTPEDTAVTNLNVLGNDSDVDVGATISLTSFTQGSHGTVVKNADNTFNYSPDQDFVGTDTFTYTISDGTLTATGTVTITVTSNNDAPVPGNDNVSTPEDTALTIPHADALANDTDPDGDTLAITGVTQSANGSVVDNGNGTITYTPNLNFNGTDTFDYTVSDGSGGTATGTVTVNVTAVNDAPDPLTIGITTPEESSHTTQNVLDPSLSRDPEGDTVVLAGFVTLPTHGTVNDNLNGTFTYTPNDNFFGADFFTYNIKDVPGNLTAEGRVDVNVRPLPDSPIAGLNSLSVTEDVAATTGNLLANAVDPDDLDPTKLKIIGFTPPRKGTVVNNLNGTLTYTPNPNVSGIDTLIYNLIDGNGGASVGTVDITITAVNDNPVAGDDTVTTDEDKPVTIANVLGNDNDVDGGILIVNSFTQPANGIVTQDSNATFTYTPKGNFNGADSFTYVVIDQKGGSATGTVKITVTAVNDAPDAVTDSDNTPQNTAVEITVLSNDRDPDGDTLSVTAHSQGTNGSVTDDNGVLTYTPNNGFTGSDSFTYSISDGKGLTATGNVNVTVAAASAGSPTTTLNLGLPIPGATGFDRFNGIFTFDKLAGFTKIQLCIKEGTGVLAGEFVCSDIEITVAKLGAGIVTAGMGLSGLWYLWMSLIAGGVVGLRTKRFFIALLVVGSLAFTGCSRSDTPTSAGTPGVTQGTAQTTELGLKAATTYQWKIVATNPTTGEAIESEVRTFSTQ